MTLSWIKMWYGKLEVISNGPKERRNLKELEPKGNKHARMQKGANSTVISTSLLIAWFHLHVFWNLCKAACIFDSLFSSLRNPIWGTCKINSFQFFSAVVCKSYDWLISFTKKTP